MELSKLYINKLTYKILGCCIEVHKELGPGLLESVYHRCLFEEFRNQKLTFETQVFVPILYKNVELNAQLRADFLIENCIVLELKAIDCIAPIHEAQVLTYMRLLKAPKGILVNFNSINIFKNGQRTLVNELFRALPD